jgi:Fe-S-cluster containining protein
MATDLARVHLELLGEPRSFELTIPVGPITLDELLPVARDLTAQVAEIAIEAAGGKVSCGRGCGACCRQKVTITEVEAHRLAAFVAQLPEPRQSQVRERFFDAIRRLEAAELLGSAGNRGWLTSEHGDAARDEIATRYFKLGIPCPFLEDESCSIHPERPLVCREYLVTSSPTRCARYLEQPIDMVAYLGTTRAFGRASRRLLPQLHEGVTLVLALEYAERHATLLEHRVDGVAAFRTFLEEIGKTEERSSVSMAQSSPGGI